MATLVSAIAAPAYGAGGEDGTSDAAVIETDSAASDTTPYIPEIPTAAAAEIPETATELSVAGALEAGTYKLTDDINGELTIAKNTDVTIYLNSHNITNSDGNAITNEGTLTVIGTGEETISGIYGIASTASLTVKNCTVYGTGDYGISATKAGTVNIENCLVYAVTAGIYSIGSQSSRTSITSATLTATDSIFYGTGAYSTVTDENGDEQEIAIPNKGWGICNGGFNSTGTTALPCAANLTGCWVGGYAGGVNNAKDSTLTMTNCDRYVGFTDISGADGGSKQVVMNDYAQSLTISGGFDKVGGRITGGNMDISDVTGGKLIPSGGRTVTINNCVLDKIDCSNTMLYSPAAVTIKNTTLNSINYSVSGDTDSGTGTANVTLENVTAANNISLYGTTAAYNYVMTATIKNCEAAELNVLYNAGGTVEGGTYESVSFCNANSQSTTDKELTITDASIGTLYAGSSGDVCQPATVTVGSGTTVGELYIRGNNTTSTLETAVVLASGSTLNGYVVENKNAALVKPNITIESGAVLAVASYTTYYNGVKLESNLGDYCGEGNTLVAGDGTYTVGTATTGGDPTPEPAELTFHLAPKGTKAADDRLYIDVSTCDADGNYTPLEDEHKYKSDIDVTIRVYGKYSEIYRVKTDESGDRDSMFDLDYINVSGQFLLVPENYTVDTNAPETAASLPSAQETLKPIDPIISESEKYFNKTGNGCAYTYTAKLGDLANAAGTDVEITPRCKTWSADEIFGSGNCTAVTPVTEDGKKVYHISNAKQLNYISYLSLNYETFKDKKIVLDGDIDMSGVCPDTGCDETGYIPIGAYTRFQGEFDGAGHKITNFNYKRSGLLSQYSEEYTDRKHYANVAGIIGRTLNANIHDMNIDNCKITLTEGASVDSIYGGVLCGQSDNSTFSNINMTGCENEGAYFGGTLLGHTDGGVTITDCKISGCTFGRKWDDGGQFIGYSCGTTKLIRCDASSSTGGAVFIGTPNIGDHYLIDCTTQEVRETNGQLAPIINEIRDTITHDGNLKGRVFIEWTAAQEADLRGKTDMHEPQEAHTNEASKMPDLGDQYNDEVYAIADTYTYTYGDKMTSRCPKNYTTRRCYDANNNIISNMLEVVYYDHYIADDELRYQTSTNTDGSHNIRFISECHTLHWDYVGYRIWVVPTDTEINNFLENSVYLRSAGAVGAYENKLDQRVTNPETGADVTSRYVWHTLDGGQTTTVEHLHPDSYFFTKTITGIPNSEWSGLRLVVQPYIVRTAWADEAWNGVPNSEHKINNETTTKTVEVSDGSGGTKTVEQTVTDDTSFGAIYVITPSGGGTISPISQSSYSNGYGGTETAPIQSTAVE